MEDRNDQYQKITDYALRMQKDLYKFLEKYLNEAAEKKDISLDEIFKIICTVLNMFALDSSFVINYSLHCQDDKTLTAKQMRKILTNYYNELINLTIQKNSEILADEESLKNLTYH